MPTHDPNKPPRVTNLRQTPTQIRRREKICRFIESRGGVVNDLVRKDFAAAVGISPNMVHEDVTRLEQYGVVQVTRSSVIGKGTLPNCYRLLQPTAWFLEHAAELEQARRRRALRAGQQIRHVEENKIRQRDAERMAKAVARRDRLAREKRGLPAEPPQVGEAEPKTVPVSAKLRKSLIDESLALPTAELSAWGA